MVQLHRLAVAAGILVAVLLGPGLVQAPPVAQACSIDNTASLSANGVRATPTASAPNSTARWAPFSFDAAFASGAPVTLSELRSDLARTLKPATLMAAYRWVFGDGAAALGHVVTHRYAHPGLYRLIVYGFSYGTRSWFPFDSALVHIVRPDQLTQANLGYYALNALGFLMSGLMWLIDAALVLLVLYVVVSKLRRRRIEPTA